MPQFETGTSKSFHPPLRQTTIFALHPLYRRQSAADTKEGRFIRLIFFFQQRIAELGLPPIRSRKKNPRHLFQSASNLRASPVVDAASDKRHAGDN
jgi:hypothetical protein